MSRRDDLAAALAAIPGLDMKAQQPDTLTPGAAWPMWVRTTWLTDCAREETWQVIVVLPSGSPESTADAADGLLQPIFAALSAAGAYIDEAAPTSMLTQEGGSPVPLLRVTTRITDS